MVCKVLIVEDEVIHAMGLADAIRVSEEQRPDVALVDVSMMGKVDGIGAAREITGWIGIPVIFMSLNLVT